MPVAAAKSKFFPAIFPFAASCLLLCASTASPGRAEGEMGGQTLIEKALDTAGDEAQPQSESAPQSPPPGSLSVKEETSKRSVPEHTAPQQSLPAKAEPSRLEPTQEAGNSFLQPPIHSILPMWQPTVLGVSVGGMKVGKTHPIDPAYRGKPVLPVIPTVSTGSAPWAIPAKKQVSALPPVVPSNTAARPLSQEPPGAKKQATATVNLRFLTPWSRQSKDTVWAYPYPPKPPKQVKIDPLPDQEAPLKNMILSLGYAYKPDTSRPYPNGGWRWIHAFQTAMKKSGTRQPHTIITMYPWVNKMYPYVLSECRELNRIEEERSKNYDRVIADYERVHVDLESQAAARGLFPLEIKINPRGIGQYQLPEGNWWIAATRKSPGLKFYWQVPVSSTANQTINVQMTELNALIISGGW